MSISDAATVDARAQLQSLMELVSPRCGLMKAVSLRVKNADEPDLPIICDGLLSHFDFRKGEGIERGTSGKGATEEQAMLGAIGEAVERYCASHAPHGAMHRAAIADLDGDVVSPEELVLYSDAQYGRNYLPFSVWKPSNALLWVRVKELTTERPVWAPATFAFLSAPAIAEQQDYLCASTSSGFASGVDVAHAARAAIIELIERDAFVIAWLNRLAVREIDLERTDGVTTEIVRTFGRWGTKLRAFLLPTDLPAVPIMTIALDETGTGPAAVIALGCEMRPRPALEKAIFEMCQVHEPMLKAHRDGRGESANAYADVRSLEQHAGYFFRRDHLQELDFLLERPASVSIDEVQGHGGPAVEDDLQTLDGAFRAIGSRVLYRDVTTPDLAGYPIRVVRALATHIQPIHFGYGQERLGGRRLYELPAKLGQSDGPRLEASLNPCPHPLA